MRAQEQQTTRNKHAVGDRNAMKVAVAVERFGEWSKENRSRETARTYASHTRRFARWLGAEFGEEVTQQAITPATLRRYMDTITQGKTSGARYVYTTALRAFCEWLKAEGLLRGTNPAKSALRLPRVHSRPHTPVTDAQVLRLWQATYGMDKPYRAKLARAIIALLAYTGLRKSELLAVNVEHVCLGEGLLYIPSGKGAKEAYVGLNDETVTALSEFLRARDPGCRHNGLLCLTCRARMQVGALYSLLDDLCARAGIKEKLRPHQFRHGFASRLDSKGASMFQIKEALRHEKVVTTERYVHSSASKLRAVAALATIQKPGKVEVLGKRHPIGGGGQRRLRRHAVRTG